MNPVIDAIHERRSIRDFTSQPVDFHLLMDIIEAGTWAPSGLNNQPWRFAIVTNPETKALFEPLTRYGKVIRRCQALIPVFIDKDAMYHEVKDHQAMGACIQNMLLAAHSMGLGAVWLGEILKNAARVRELLGLSENLELMAVIAMGYPASKDQHSNRKPLDEVIVYKG